MPNFSFVSVYYPYLTFHAHIFFRYFYVYGCTHIWIIYRWLDIWSRLFYTIRNFLYSNNKHQPTNTISLLVHLNSNFYIQTFKVTSEIRFLSVTLDSIHVHIMHLKVIFPHIDLTWNVLDVPPLCGGSLCSYLCPTPWWLVVETNWGFLKVTQWFFSLS